MTLAVESPVTEATATGLTGNFVVGYSFTAASDLQVTVTVAGTPLSARVLGVHYTVTGDYRGGGGVVSFVAAHWPAEDAVVEIRRATPIEQPSPFGDLATFRPNYIEEGFDRAFRVMQEVKVAAETGLRGATGAKGDPGGNVMAAGLFDDLPALTVPTGADIIRTTGRTAVGQGDAFYVDADGEILEPAGEGVWWATTANGRIFRLAGPVIAGDAVAAINGYSASGLVYGDDDGPALNQVFASRATKIALPQSALSPDEPTVSTPGRYTLIDTPVYVPYNKGIDGQSAGQSAILISHTPSAGMAGGVFRLNLDAANAWITPFPNTPCTPFRNLKFSAFQAAANGHKIRAFTYGGSPLLEDCQTISFAEFARAGVQYSDSPTFRRITCLEQPVGDTTKWLLNHSQGQGDCGLIEQFHALGESIAADGGSYARAQGVYLFNRSGWAIRQIINGDIFVTQCRAVELTGLYMERGKTTIENSRGAKLKDSVYFMRDSGPQAITPVVIQGVRAGTTPWDNNHFGEVENVGFLYDPLGQIVPWVIPAVAGNFDKQSRPNFSITGYGRFSFRNLYREFGAWGYTANKVMGVTSGYDVFDDYSHIASRQSEYVDGRWIFSDKLPALTSFSMAAIGPHGDLPFSLASGTYRYKPQFLYDRNRLVGVDSAEQSLSLTQQTVYDNGGAGVIRTGILAPCMLRLYRASPGVAAGQYDAYVDVPLMDGGYFYDMGDSLNGWPWIARTAAVPTPINTVDVGFAIEPSLSTTTSDAYGKAVCRTSVTTEPQYGSWRLGDIIEFTAPIAGKQSELLVQQIGWRRMSSCTLAAPTVAWEPIYEVIGQQNVILDTDDADYTLTAGTDSVRRRHGGSGLTADRTVSFSGSFGRFHITRTSVGAFNLILDVQPTPRNLATNQWAEVGFSNGNWWLLAAGDLY